MGFWLDSHALKLRFFDILLENDTDHYDSLNLGPLDSGKMKNGKLRKFVFFCRIWILKKSRFQIKKLIHK